MNRSRRDFSAAREASAGCYSVTSLMQVLMVSPNVVRSAAGRCSRGRQCRLRRSAAHSPGDTHRIFNRSVGRPNATQRCRGSHELASDGCNPSSRPSSHAAARRCPRTFTSGGGKREGTRAPDAIADISRIDERRLGSVICHRGSDILAITSAIQRRQSRMCCKCFQRDARVPVPLSHAPDVTAARIVVPCSTRPSASATNNQESEPVSRSASQPPPMATNMGRKPAVSGQNSRPAPCEAK